MAVHAVVLALVLPLVFGLLPQPAISAAAALERDIAASVCDSSGQGAPAEGGTAHAGHGHCILCPACAAALGPAPASGTPAFSTALRRSGSFPPARLAGLPPPLRALLDASPPRGPPAASLA